MQENTKQENSIPNGFILFELKDGELSVHAKNANPELFKAMAQTAVKGAINKENAVFKFVMDFTTVVLSEFFLLVPEAVLPFLQTVKKFIRKINKINKINKMNKK